MPKPTEAPTRIQTSASMIQIPNVMAASSAPLRLSSRAVEESIGATKAWMRSLRRTSTIASTAAATTAAVIAAVFLAIVLVRRNERIHAFVAPMLSSTARLLSGHGALLVAITFAIWIIEALTWILVGASVGFGMSFLEGLYLVALASVFALIPSGPGYAGTQDAAAVIGIKAIGGTGATAVSYLVMLRFVLLVPITAFGFLLLVTRYGGLARARAGRA